jgi:hypothetical protein
MAVTVTNVSDMVLLIRLRTGGSVHLRPGERTGELAGAEVYHNPRVDTLVERRLVRIDDVAAAPAETTETSASGETVEATATSETAKPRRGRAASKASEGGSG